MKIEEQKAVNAVKEKMLIEQQEMQARAELDRRQDNEKAEAKY